MYVTNAQLKHICFKKVSKNYVPKRAHANVAKQHFLFFCPIFHPRFECLFSEWYWQQNEIDYSNLHREMVNPPPPPPPYPWPRPELGREKESGTAEYRIPHPGVGGRQEPFQPWSAAGEKKESYTLIYLQGACVIIL